MKRTGKKILGVFMAALFLVLSGAAAVQAEEPSEVFRIRPDRQEGTRNYFRYQAYEGKEWVSESGEAYIDLGSSDARAQECYYEVSFEGSGIEVFAVKDSKHGKVQYSVDGEHIRTVDLYYSERTQEQSVYKVSGLAEGEHVLKAVTQKEKSGSAVVNQVAYVEVTHAPYMAWMGGTVSDINTQHTQDKYGELSKQENRSAELTAWKNDKAVSELVLYSKEGSLKNVTVTAGDLMGSKGVISRENITATFIKSTSAYNGGSVWGSEPPEVTAGNRSEVSDILYQTEPIDIPYDSLQPVWVEFFIPKDAEAGTYVGTLKVTADNIEEAMVFTCKIHVQDAVLPDADSFKDTFDIELWQYPYSSAEYYDVEPFSEEHFSIMRSSMLKYKEIGGHAITTSVIEEAWEGQTYSKNEIHYPSMVKWTKQADGSFSYDYTDFDKWVSFNKSLGIGDKIVLYSVAPWHNSFTYWENGSLTYEWFTPGSDRYIQVWTDFLENLIAHLEEKGWFDESYIGIDERGFCNEAFDLIASVKNSQGKALKTAGAMNSFVEKKELALRVMDLNVGDTAAADHPEDFQKLVEDRNALGYKTTLYSCTGHIPGNFSLSAPVESYWSIVNAGKLGTAGFLRWAYDAWVDNPLEDTTHSKYEPGDCFLIYPDLKNAENPVSKSSVRLERMAQGVRDINKLMLIEKENPSLAGEIQKLYGKVSTTARGCSSSWEVYLDAEGVVALCDEMDAFREGLEDLTWRYVAERDGLTEELREIAIVEGNNAELNLGTSMQLHTMTLPENSLHTDVLWFSEDEEIVTVDAQGNMTGKKEGTTVLTAESAWDGEKKASITITVGKESLPKADLTELNAALKEAEAKEEADYTAESWAKFWTAFVAAKETMAKEGVSQTETDQAKKTLQEAMNGLIEKTADHEPKKGEIIKISGGRYQVTDPDKKTVKLVEVKNRKATKLNVPSTVKRKGVTYKVTGVGKNIMKGNKKLKKVILGKNVAVIEKDAFAGCKNLKSVQLKGKALNTVQKGAFGKTASKMMVSAKKMDKKQKKLLKKRMRKAGMSKKGAVK